MAAEVDFGDLELFEAFDHPEESIPKPIHTHFKDDDGDEEDENGVGDAELRERLRQCEETIERLRAENILPARWALSPGRVPSSVMLEEDHKVEESSAVKSNKEAFSNIFGTLRVSSGEELQDALGVTDKSLPPFIYRMRQLGYPPGWLKEAELENSGLALYDGKGIPSMRSSIKRCGSRSSPGSPKKQKREGSLAASPADMELDSDAEVPHGSLSSGAFQFQPPLPPGTPPPLPQGTPPATFTPPLPKGTPPLTPSDSPQARAASVPMDEDALTLEELEEQQRRIWAALEQAESANSDSDVPVDTPVTGNSVASSPCPNEPDLPVPEGKTSEKQVPDEAEVPDTCSKQSEAEPSSSPDPEAASPGQKEKEEFAQADAKDAPLDNGRVESPSQESPCDVRNGGSSQKPLHRDISPPTATKTHSPVPDMSKFATGITPFEFENMAESTGMYLRIRSLLKNSPRSQQRNKKAPE
ncbi:zinc finger CCHC domain-containing protein 8 [Camelus ferus]|nr:zinc finger CCHC domain-containing protein 8 [Camelus ferus]